MPAANRVIDDHGELAGLSDDDHAQYGWRIAEGRGKIGATVHLNIPGVDISVISSNGVGANIIRYAPFFVRTAITITALWAEVISTLAGASDVARLGITMADTDWQPATNGLVLDAGTIGVGTNGIKTLTLGSPLTLQPGRYLSAINSNASGVATLRSYRAGGGFFGLLQSLGASPLINVARVGLAYGAFTSTLPAWTTVDASSAGIGHYFLFQISVP